MSDEDNFPDPYPKPQIVSHKLDPLPPLPKGWKGLLLALLKASAKADWLRRQANLDDHSSRFNAVALQLWEVENALEKRRRVEARIAELEGLPITQAQALATVERQVIDDYAEYQLKRDYFGDMNPEALRAEYRAMLRSRPDAALLRESTNPDVLRIVGNARLLPAPSSATDTEAELARLKRIRDKLPKHSTYTGTMGGHLVEAARISRLTTGQTGQPLSEREYYLYFQGGGGWR